ncbi:hypothetical protein AB0M35_28215 [Micromonospora sp. NPDC051196]|uniref:hypothetical protein n=1 Tax=Micromonospora sp. NPDC051196 TaxID=3155281 RepID=UPI00341CE2F8
MNTFQANRTYDNVFLIFVDAAGHSNVVAHNPRDLARQAFDLLHRKVTDRLSMIAEQRRVDYARPWRWAGDGGFLIVHDEDESVARDVTLEYVNSLLTLDLPHLRDEFTRLGIQGSLRLRVAAHKGSIRYRGEGNEGTIYSPDINFVAHLEKVTPPDTVAVSADVVQVAGPYAKLFEPVGEFEGRQIHLFAADARTGGAASIWLAAQGLVGGVPVNAYFERPSQLEKARMVRAATTEVVDLGTSLRTASRYLVTTERPAHFRDAVLDFLDRGGTYRCVLMAPDSEATRLLSRQRGEDLAGKTHAALADLRQFKQRHGAAADRLEVLQTPGYPGMACLATDLDSPYALILTSPYLMAPPGPQLQLQRGDMPHYLITRSAGPLFDHLRSLVQGFATSSVERVL